VRRGDGSDFTAENAENAETKEIRIFVGGRNE
jgi:hypothetical protein